MTFRPLPGDNWALYIEGQRCAYYSAEYSYGGMEIPSFRLRIPATPELEDLPDRTSFQLVYRDPVYHYKIGFPRFNVMFEGELRAPGFALNVAGQRALQFMGEHISNNLGMEIRVLSPDDYITAKIQGRDETQIVSASFTGTIWEQFKPDNIIKLAQENEEIQNRLKALIGGDKKFNETFDIYDYVPLAFTRFKQIVDESLVINDYRSRALDFYDFNNRIYYPNIKDWKFDWKDLYNQILFAYYVGTVGKAGDNINFLEIAQSMLNLFLFEISIQPNPKSWDQTLLVKPQNHFAPVPSCNVIYPVHQPQYSFNENYAIKPTRLVQITYPPNGFPLSPENEAYYRNISPPELREKFNTYQEVRKNLLSQGVTVAQKEINLQFVEALNAKNYSVYGLLTEEEKERGIVYSQNTIPSYLTTLFTAILYKREQLKDWSNFSTMFTTAVDGGTISYDKKQYTTEESIAMTRMYKLDQALRSLENKTSKSSDEALISNPNCKCFIPRKIILVPRGKGANVNLLSKLKIAPNYQIVGNQVFRLCARNYGLLEECKSSGKIPFYLSTEVPNFNKTLELSNAEKKWRSNGLILQTNDFNSPYDTKDATRMYSSINIAYKGGGSSNINLKVALLTWRSCIIEFDPTSDIEIKKTIELIGLLKSMFGYGSRSSYSTHIDNNRKGIIDLSYIIKGITFEKIAPNLLTHIKNESQAIFEKDQNTTFSLESKREAFNIQSFIVSSNKVGKEANYTNSGAPNSYISSSGGGGGEATSDIVNSEIGSTFLAGAKEKAAELGAKGESKFYSNLTESLTNSDGKALNFKTIKDNLQLTTDTVPKFTQDLKGAADSLSRESESILGVKVSSEFFASTFLNSISDNNKNSKAGPNNVLGMSKEVLANSQAHLGLELTGKMNDFKKIAANPQAILKKISDSGVSQAQTAFKDHKDVLQKMVLEGVKGLPLAMKAAEGYNYYERAKSLSVDALKEKSEELKLKEMDQVYKKASNVVEEVYNSIGNQIVGFMKNLEPDDIKLAKERGFAVIAQSTKDAIFNELGFKPISTDQILDLKDVYNNYSQVLCDYFYYINRYRANSISLPVIANPYITPGFPGLILDSAHAQNKKHILMYVSKVSQYIERGNLRTTISCNYARRSDEWKQGGFTSTTESKEKPKTPLLGDEVKQFKEDQSYAKLFEQLNEIPFLGGGEYSTAQSNSKKDIDGKDYDSNSSRDMRRRIDDTYQKVLGKNVRALRDFDVAEAESKNLENIFEAYEKNIRSFQTVAIIDCDNPKVKSIYEDWFKEAQSFYAFKWSELKKDTFEFPDNIYILDPTENYKGTQNKPRTTSSFGDANKNPLLKEKVINGKSDYRFQFDSVIAEKVKLHTDRCRNIEGIMGAGT